MRSGGRAFGFECKIKRLGSTPLEAAKVPYELKRKRQKENLRKKRAVIGGGKAQKGRYAENSRYAASCQ